MKKALLLLTLVFASLQVNAKDLDNKFYLGGEGLINMYTSYTVPGASILGGYRWNEFSAEVGFTKLTNDDWGQGLKFKSNNIFADVIYTQPLYDKLEFKGLVGLGLFHTKVYNTSDSLTWIYQHGKNETDLGVRAGIGLQYQIAPKWTADFTYKFQTNCNTFIGYMNIFSVGVRYYL